MWHAAITTIEVLTNIQPIIYIMVYGSIKWDFQQTIDWQWDKYGHRDRKKGRFL